jgi:RNA polymerase sigma-70 factor (ECF subfamily)
LALLPIKRPGHQRAAYTENMAQKNITGKASLLGSCSDAFKSLEPATVLSEPVFLGTITKGTTLNQESDENRWSAFMVNAQAGNESDYRQLLTELTDVIYNFLRSRFGNHHFIEDCVQESLIAVHQARHTYDPRRHFRPWLFAIVRHKAIDTLRRQRTRQKVVDQYKGEQEILSRTSHQSEAENEVTKGRLLESLSVQHREVLLLTKIIGFSIAETSEKLGISQSAVKVRVHRAIRKLEQLMETEEV